MLNVKQGSCEYQGKDIGLTRLGIKAESTAPEADDLTIQPSELLEVCFICARCPSLHSKCSCYTASVVDAIKYAS